MLMKKTLVSAILAASSLVVANANAEGIAFVSTERILRDAVPAKTAQARLEKEFASRDKEIQGMAAQLKSLSAKLDKDAPVLSDTDRQKRQRELADLDREYQRRLQAFREDLNQRRNEELSVVLERADKAIKQIAETDKYDIVFQEAVYVSPRIDITDKVLQALSK